MQEKSRTYRSNELIVEIVYAREMNAIKGVLAMKSSILKLGINFIASLLAVSIFSSACSAELKSFDGTGTYTMSSFETMNVAEQRAIQAAERDALEKAGVYVSSYTKTENLEVTKDEVIVLTNGIMQLTSKNITKEMTSAGDIHIRADIVATIDTDQINKNLQNRAQLDRLTQQYKSLEKVAKEQEAEIERLKKLSQNSNEKQKAEIDKKGKVLENRFLSNQKLDEAGKMLLQGKSDAERYQVLSDAVIIDPTNTWAYLLRSPTALMLGYYQQTISDTTHVLNLAADEKDDAVDLFTIWMTYTERGMAFEAERRYSDAIADFTRAISIKKNAFLYKELANSYEGLKKYDKAIENYTIAIAMSHDSDKYSYLKRAMCYAYKQSWHLAYFDLQKCLQLDPENEAALKMMKIIQPFL